MTGAAGGTIPMNLRAAGRITGELFHTPTGVAFADLTIDGKLRHVIIQAPKNGFFYVLDRKSGELLSAQAYTYVNWASGVDLKTGRPKTKIGRAHV